MNRCHHVGFAKDSHAISKALSSHFVVLASLDGRLSMLFPQHQIRDGFFFRP